MNLYSKSPKPLREMVRSAYFVPETVHTDELFRDMQKNKTHMAIIVDEYGGTHGVITLTDLIEEIVGDLDETEDEKDIVRSGEGYIISGQTERRDLDELFDIETDSDSSTIGGWVMEQLEKIPETGDELEADGIKVKVTKADDKRVIELYAEKLPEESDDEKEEDGNEKEEKSESDKE